MSIHANESSTRRPSHAKSRAFGYLGALGVVFSALAGSGCSATFTPEPIAVTYEAPVVRADVVPVDIELYPRVQYRGTYAYLVGDRWYYPTRGGWVILREEPVELRTYRTRVYPRGHGPAYPAYPRERPREIQRYRRY